MRRKKKEGGREGLPLDGVLELANRSRALHFVLEHCHVLQIIEDHQLMWFESKSDAERRSVCSRLRRQIARALGRVAAFDAGLHGAVVAVSSDFAQGSLLFLAAVVLAYMLGKGT